jgi:hypothetical protein
MNPSHKFRLSTGMVVAVTFFPSPDQALGQNTFRPYNHDGIYSVHIVTETGGCDRSYLWTIAISGGRVSSTGSTPLEASGQINPQGKVALAFRGYNEVAHVVGKMSGRQGSGTWTSPTMACAGTWWATRQS